MADKELKKAVSREKSLRVIDTQNALCDLFDGEQEYIERRIAVPDVRITKDNLEDIITDILALSSVCAGLDPENYLFSTGIYELSAHYFSGMDRISDIDEEALKKHPFVIVKAQDKNKWKLDFSHHSDGMVCAYYPDSQDLFSVM